MTKWPHQLRAVSETLNAINSGAKRIVLCSPTGGGKTRIALDLADLIGKEGAQNQR